MFDILSELIEQIMEEYSMIYQTWSSDNQYLKINLAKLQVRDIKKEENNILDIILAYRLWISNNIIPFSLKLQSNKSEKYEINTRVKAQNSVEFKLDNYQRNHANGKVSINKSFNDIYGIRIILKENTNYELILKYIKENYPALRCIHALRDENNYEAIHVYFKIDNYSFPWELQIWNQEDKQRNIVSHEKYKQAYTKWEKENKGGDHIG